MQSDTLRLHLGVRSGDADVVAEILDRRPDLVDAPEDWDGSWLRAGVAPHSQKGTPLGRAVALGQRRVIDVLLSRGASIDGGCGCMTRESPLWTAVACGRDELVAMLLEQGASPRTATNLGTTPMHIAAMRGDLACVELLLGAGADPDALDHGGRKPLDWARERGHAAVVQRLGGSAQALSTAPRVPRGPVEQDRAGVLETGIKAFDLFCPLGRGRVLRQQARVGYGHLALLGELTQRLRVRTNTVVAWCGFEPRPYAKVDLETELFEFGLSRVDLPLIRPEDPPEEAAARLLAHVRELRREAEESAIDVVVIAIEEVGHAAAIEAILPLFGVVGGGSVSGIVSSPFRTDPDGPQLEAGPPYAGQVAFDLERVHRGQWPAISSVSRSLDETPLASEARRILAAGGAPAAQLHEWLSQRFYVQEVTWATPGQWVPWKQTEAELRSLVARAT